jgi:hypothetical protein
MHGQPSKRQTVVKMADHARLPRTEFLRASGYLPGPADERWDWEHFAVFPTLPAPLGPFEDDGPTSRKALRFIRTEIQAIRRRLDALDDYLSALDLPNDEACAERREDSAEPIMRK